MNSSCLRCLYLIPFVCATASCDKKPWNQSSRSQCKAYAPSAGPAARHILITLMAESQLYYHLHSGSVRFEEPPMLSVDSERRSFQGRVLRSTQWLLQDKELKWLPLRACSTESLENVGPWEHQKEREGGKAIAPFVKPISGFHPSFPHPPHFSSVTIMKCF